MKSNDNIPEDEFVLAELIAAANEHGLVGCRGSYFQDPNGNEIEITEENPNAPHLVGNLQKPPKGAVSCCALGAQMLARHVSKPIAVGDGNDASSDQTPSGWFLQAFDKSRETEALRDWNIGAVFNLAMDPRNEV